MISLLHRSIENQYVLYHNDHAGSYAGFDQRNNWVPIKFTNDDYEFFFDFMSLCHNGCGLDFCFSLSFCFSSTSNLPQAIRLSRVFLRLHSRGYLSDRLTPLMYGPYSMVPTKKFTPNDVRS